MKFLPSSAKEMLHATRDFAPDELAGAGGAGAGGAGGGGGSARSVRVVAIKGVAGTSQSSKESDGSLSDSGALDIRRNT